MAEESSNMLVKKFPVDFRINRDVRIDFKNNTFFEKLPKEKQNKNFEDFVNNQSFIFLEKEKSFEEYDLFSDSQVQEFIGRKRVVSNKEHTHKTFIRYGFDTLEKELNSIIDKVLSLKTINMDDSKERNTFLSRINAFSSSHPKIKEKLIEVLAREFKELPSELVRFMENENLVKIRGNFLKSFFKNLKNITSFLSKSDEKSFSLAVINGSKPKAKILEIIQRLIVNIREICEKLDLSDTNYNFSSKHFTKLNEKKLSKRNLKVDEMTEIIVKTFRKAGVEYTAEAVDFFGINGIDFNSFAFSDRSISSYEVASESNSVNFNGSVSFISEKGKFKGDARSDKNYSSWKDKDN